MTEEMTPEIEQKMRQLANLMIDRILLENRLTSSEKGSNLELDQNFKYGTKPNYTA